MKRIPLFLAVASLLVAGSSTAAEKLSRENVEFFESNVRPLLVKHCYQCHAEDAKEIKGGLLLDSRQGWVGGGDGGAVIVPGEPDKSTLIQAVRYEDEDLEMPPKGKLSDGEIAVLERWVAMGAPDPRDDDTAGLIKREINVEEGRQYWAFQPPQHKPAPQVKNDSWPASDIDRFVLAKLEANGIGPAPDASPEVLIRRLYFDLVGLPPTPEAMELWTSRLTAPQREARQNSRSPSPRALPAGSRLNDDALNLLVDELLASPQFGERWGRHWLDVARYAESTGMERNVTFPAAWRYRDYVIESLNNDKPYDQFVREQLAGDLLPDTSPSNRDERLIATGFLAMGPKSLNERDRDVFVMDVVDEQIDVTTRAMMGVTVSCARCHDHKFDPFPQRDYYALAGIFRSCNTLSGATGGQGNRQPSSLIPLGAAESDKPQADDKADDKQEQIAKLAKQLNETKAELGKSKDDKQRSGQLKQQIKRLNQKLAQLRGGNNKRQGGGKLPSGPAAMGVVDANIADCRLHIRGNTKTLGEEVPRGFLQVVSLDNTPAINNKSSGRLELANYLTSADNPLTARVMANRAWHWLFGQGIVRTVDNFGSMGERPENPELLDHLAVRFVDEGWSLKKLLREIVLSRTYRLASDHDEASFAKDPENLLTWRQNHRRLDAESLRDAMLAISGRLDRTPAESSPVAKMVGVNVGRTTDALRDIESGKFTRRSVYLPILRNALPEALSVFDFAEPSIIVGRRQVTTVPAQALYMMNSDFVVAQADALAERLLKDEVGESNQRIRRAYESTLCRAPTADELERSQLFINSFDSAKPNAEQESLAALCQALLASAEFRYIE